MALSGADEQFGIGHRSSLFHLASTDAPRFGLAALDLQTGRAGTLLLATHGLVSADAELAAC